jgi:hypothetical protein
MTFYMADHSKHSIIGATGRGVSPALSDFSELTILSRSPSPVLDYNVSHCSLDSDPVDPGYVEQKLRGQDGRYVSRKTKRAHSPDGRYVNHRIEAKAVLTPLQTNQKDQVNR